MSLDENNSTEQTTETLHNHESECKCHQHHHSQEHEYKHEYENHNLGSEIHCGCGHCHDEDEHKEGNPLKKIIIALILFVAGLLLEHLPLDFSAFPKFEGKTFDAFASTVIFFFAYIIVGKDSIRNAIANIRKGDFFDESFLMSVASLGAVFTGEIPEAVAVMLFYQIGEYFEDYAVDKSKDSINALMEICPDKATVLRNGTEITVEAEEVQIGETIIVRPGERIPVDGTVVKGKSFIDNSALTGESVPQEVFEGNEIYSGAINKSGVLEIKTTRPASDSAASRILKLVEESSEKKTKTERFITRFSKIYTPLVCAAAILVAVIPTTFTGLSTGIWEWQTWIHRALMLLVVSCPCALVISVPLTFFGGIGASSRKGILVKGSSSIENLSKLGTVVFDKTGTLTKGVFTVTEIHSENPEKYPEDELVALAAHAETYSNHPAAKSIKSSHNHTEKCTIANISGAEEIAGQGIKAVIEEKIVLAGNQLLMESNSVTGFKKASPETAGTIVYVAVNGEFAGHILISDQTKEDAKNAIISLRKQGVKRVVMLTGDNSKTAEIVANQLGINEFFANLLPQDKVSKIEEIIARNTEESHNAKTAFAGDGINDAPVLSRADVGIAMGALGSDAAIESADVVIMTDEPSKIAEGIKISRKTMGIVYQNITVSLAVKVGIMIFSALGITNMWIAVFGDVGVCFLAILNAMRTLKIKKSE